MHRSLGLKEVAKVIIEKDPPGVQLLPDSLEVLELWVLLGQSSGCFLIGS